MPTMSRRVRRWAGRTAIATGVAAASVGSGAIADVKTSTRIQTYSVGGTTAHTLVSYMRSNPFHGSRGDAVANIRPNYRLNVASRQSGGTCRPSNVTLNIDFVMTLPKARNQLDSTTRSAWNAFVAFTKRHEETHRSIYVKCGNDFVAKAERLSAATCSALDAAIRRLLEVEKAVCDVRQRAFDRAEYGRVASLGLFKLATRSSRASR
jgi:predicted secreted Zn-dependent protease